MTLQGQYVQKTHSGISQDWVGKVEKIETDQSSVVSLATHQEMKADEKGLVHGGFTFSLADYAAMVAVNDPFVVLLSSQVKFLMPVVVGDRLTAHARITEREGRKRKVGCEVFNQNEQKVFEGEFLCVVLSNHVLSK